MYNKFMRRLTLIISILLLSFSLISPTQTSAADTNNDLLKIYQDRRSGNQMNLETWYGGKYGGTTEESIGFGDIILLDLMEKVGGSSEENAQELEKLLDGMNMTSSKTSKNETSILSNLQNYSQGGAISGTARIITSLYQTTPASSTEYLAYVQNNLHDKKIVKTAYADNGYGFTSLQPLLKFWKIFRNIAYFFFVLGFIIYGFMIMFRIKINPQTAITIQLALPKLIVTLLLITFSYAIAGFMIDFFYLFWGIIGNIFITQGFKGVNFISGYNNGLLIPMVGGIISAVKFLIVDLWAIILPIPQFVSAAIGATITYAFAPLSLVLMLIVLIAIFFTFIKIFWMLLKSYVNIVLSIIFSPFILLGNIIPGSKSFGGWIKGIFAELSVFISVMIMFVLSFYFTLQIEWFNDNAAITSSGSLWIPPPLVGQIATDNILGTNSASAFSLLGLGILLMIPKIAEIVKNALQIKDLGYGSAIGEAFAPFKLISDPLVKEAQESIGEYAKPKIKEAWRELKSPYTKQGQPSTRQTTIPSKKGRRHANPYRP